jgi:hypothetical protein
MSFTYCFLAARCKLAELESGMLAAWPALEVVEPAQEFASWDEAFQRAGPRCGYLDGAHPNDVKLLFHDGTWSVVSDISTCMGSDTASLAELSGRVGRLVVACTQGTVGFAQLQVFEAGAAVRSITGHGGRTKQSGAAIPEESGVALETFYLRELDTIWQRLGLSSVLAADPIGPVVALHVLDRIPLVEGAAAPSQRQPARRRPRWRPW